MAKKQEHRVWEVRIGSVDDEKLGDRHYYNSGQRGLMVCKLPERASYLIEAKGQGTNAVKKALKLAEQDGITNPIALSWELVNPPECDDEP